MNIKRWLWLLMILDALFLFILAMPTAQAARSQSPAVTIQSQIDGAADGATINIGVGTFTESLNVNKSITLTGVNSATTIIQAVSGQRVITVTAGHNLTLQNLTITGGSATGNVGGGILFDSGYLKIVNCRIASNSADYGGGVFQNSTTDQVDVIGSRIELNMSSNHGGGLYIRGNIAMTDTQVLSNTASWHGGGLHTDTGHTDLIGGVFSNNRALGDNGGAVNVNKSIDITGTQFVSNTTAQDGAAVLVYDPGQAVNVTNARFERNQAKRDGGGLWSKGNLMVTNSLFISNTTDSSSETNNHGGGIYFGTGAAKIISTTFTGNRSYCTGNGCFSPTGGGIHFENAISATIQDSLFENNYGWFGGGINSNNTPTLIQRTVFRGNSGGSGGGIDASSVDIQNSYFILNSAVNEGGALGFGYNSTISGTRFISNTGGFPGGGAVLAGGNLTVTNSLFAGNQTLGKGAALQLNNNVARSLSHVTIAHPTTGNLAALQVTSGTLNITNTIITSYTVGISNTGGVVIVDYNLFYGGTSMQTSPPGSQATGPNNQTGQDPRFVNARAGDYHLRSNSPAIGAGKNLGIVIDLDGKPRSGRFDIGAYQFWTQLFLPLILR